eukprot:TRINITY_DN4775_c0_g1_i5.p1 TRINITY_DN4775_c0_g1~~TRINITY_DN4775_c0_g1_i5.p1  ORF type:complete len:130 (+),score=15.27 TRINITY_DN4775_c0_g1_i5:144-533(+)
MTNSWYQNHRSLGFNTRKRSLEKITAEPNKEERRDSAEQVKSNGLTRSYSSSRVPFARPVYPGGYVPANYQMASQLNGAGMNRIRSNVPPMRPVVPSVQPQIIPIITNLPGGRKGKRKKTERESKYSKD